MKKFLIATAALASVALAAPAFAADMPVKAPPPVAPALYNWSGFYLGPEAGAIMGQRTELVDIQWFNPAIGVAGPIIVPPLDHGHPLHGGFVGGEAGFNWQVGRWVFGIEGDGQWSELESSLAGNGPVFTANTGGFVVGSALTDCDSPTLTCGTRIRDFETVRLRIGYAFGPTGQFLAFVTGGWATANQSYLITNLSLANGPLSTVFEEWKRVNGFTVGGGAEWGITPWLTLKGEVLYINLGRETYCGLNPACTGFIAPPFGFIVTPASIKSDFVAARMGLNWRFNWGKGKGPAPVVARY